jgi:hypothetical protein
MERFTDSDVAASKVLSMNHKIRKSDNFNCGWSCIVADADGRNYSFIVPGNATDDKATVINAIKIYLKENVNKQPAITNGGNNVVSLLNEDETASLG